MARQGIAAWMTLLVFGLLASAAQAQGWESWLADVKDEAARSGISRQVLDDALDGLQENEDVVTLDQKQPEKKITFEQYYKNTVSPRRIRMGRQLLEEHRTLLTRISNRYGVQPEYIVALWGIETDYGNNQGDFSVIQSLATLAYEGRRAEFFRKELFAALNILDAQKKASIELTGSWAGAMGNCQFMPSTYAKYAVDGNGDGERDIWNTPADIFASIANYLSSIGWQGQHGWGSKVALPEDFTEEEADIKHAKSAAEWRMRGVTWASGKPLPATAAPYYVIFPGGAEGGDAYAVTENFQVLLEWNRSRYFATSVGLLADAIGE